ncbi:MAG: sigma-70 family RNA polymerase sigma factor [Acidobacteriota bacterium]
MPDHALYTQHRATLDTVIASVCRRNRLSPEDSDDFGSDFRLKLLEQDCAALARFEGRSSLHTYLVVVATRALQDWRNARWGKWRPSAEAQRLGPVAQRLERLIIRDQQTLDEAHETLRVNFGLTTSRVELEQMAARLPTRQRRTFVGDEALQEQETTDTRADKPLQAIRAAESAGAAVASLKAALARLPPTDQLILKMRFESNLSVVNISRALHLEQKPLYRHIDRLLAQLRGLIEEQGLSASTAADVLAGGGFEYLGTAPHEITGFSAGESTP